MTETHMAMIKDGVVENVAVVDPSTAHGVRWCEAMRDDGYELVDIGTPVGVGHRWDGSTFTPPPAPADDDDGGPVGW